jgi:predicted transport protein
LDFNEVQDDNGFAPDTSDHTFVVNATHQGGVLIVLRDEQQLDRAMSIVRHAHELQASV